MRAVFARREDTSPTRRDVSTRSASLAPDSGKDVGLQESLDH